MDKHGSIWFSCTSTRITVGEKGSKSCLWSQPKCCAHPRSAWGRCPPGHFPSFHEACTGFLDVSMRPSAASLDAAQDCPAPSCCGRDFQPLGEIRNGFLLFSSICRGCGCLSGHEEGPVLQPHLAVMKLSHHGTSCSRKLARWNKHPTDRPLFPPFPAEHHTSLGKIQPLCCSSPCK